MIKQMSAAPRMNDRPVGAWIPVFLGMCVICGESTQTMGAAHTAGWLVHLVSAFGPGGALASVPEMNHVLRKSGHFLGYGTLGLLFARGWYAVLRRRVAAAWALARVRAAVLAVGCTFLVACADELHQRYVPGRGSSFIDVMLDTSGAVLMNLLFFAAMWLRRQMIVERRGTMPVVRGLVSRKTVTLSRRLKKAALHRTREFLRADSRLHTQSNLDLLNRRAA